MSTLTLTRRRNMINGIAVKIDVIVDGSKVGTLTNGGRLEVTLPDIRDHVLRLQPKPGVSKAEGPYNIPQGHDAVGEVFLPISAFAPKWKCNLTISPSTAQAVLYKNAAEELTQAFAVSWLKNGYGPGGLVLEQMAQQGYHIVRVDFEVQLDRLHTVVHTSSGLKAPMDELYADMVGDAEPFTLPNASDRLRIQRSVLQQLGQELPSLRITGNSIFL